MKDWISEENLTAGNSKTVYLWICRVRKRAILRSPVR